jgi:PAB1-binding protein PBP1
MQNQFVDLYRNGIKTTAEVMRASMENAVRLQQRQLDIARSVLDESTKSAEQLSEAKNMEDLVSLQSRLAGTQMERMAEFWSSMWVAATENQKSLIEQVQSQMGQAKDRVRETYAFTTRTSEEAARVAAAQVSRASSSVRESAAAAMQHEAQRANKPNEQRKSA